MDDENAVLVKGPARVVHHTDALAWLRGQEQLEGASVVTSLPDVSELSPLSLPAWETWFADAAELVVSRVAADALAIFYQSDVKVDGHWIDKAELVARGARRAGASLVFHKIVLRTAPGIVTRGRPSYSHLVAWSRGVDLSMRDATADVLESAGPKTWTRGMGASACRAAIEAVLALTTTRTIVDPFCGHGTVLAVANAMGLDAVGVELGGKRARRARSLTIDELDEIALRRERPKP